MDVGSKLIEEYEKVLIHNELVEHTVFNVLSSDVELITVLERNDYRIYFTSYIMERMGDPFLLRILWLEIMRRMITLNGTEFAN